MGVLEKREIIPGCLLGTWEITEDYDQLMDLVELDHEEKETIQSFRNHCRKLEYLSVRVLLKELTGKNNRILYKESKKPFLRNNSCQISISHSHKLTSMLTSKTKLVGIDIEFMSHRIEKIKERFIHSDEIITNDEVLQNYHMYVHWCAKEALYKICDKGHLNFKSHLFIHPFEIADQGIIQGTVHTRNIHQTFDLHYFRRNNYVLVMCCK